MPRAVGQRLGTIVVMFSLLVGALVAAQPATASAPESAARKAPRVYLFYDYLAPFGAQGRAYKPHRFTFAEDPAYLIQGMHWGVWTKKRAVGRGYYYTGFGSGPFHTSLGEYQHRYRVKVSFWRPKRSCGHLVFSRAQFAYPLRQIPDRRFVSGRAPYHFQCNAGARQAVVAKSLAGHRWHYAAQVDGRGAADRVTFIGGRDLKLDEFGIGFGHVTVQVRLAGTRKVVSSRQFIGYTSVRRPWSPYLGATNLDRHGGKEILLGFSTGAHAQLFEALTYKAGRLQLLNAPGGSSSWMVNSSFGTGSQGWRCTAHGVQSRGVAPVGTSTTRFRVVLNRYVHRGTRWVRTSHVARIVTGSGGNPPAYTKLYPRFACAGLPARVL